MQGPALERPPSSPVHLDRSQKKVRVALLSLVASGVLATLKFIAALATGSLGLLSEALHSLVDFGATVITLIAVKLADRPADDNHHFGHAKIESLAAVVEILLLFGIAFWFAYESISRLVSGGHEVTVTWWAVGVLVLSIAVDFNRAKALKKVADETSSGALAADAAHFHADMLGSTAVLSGLGLVWAGVPWGDSIATLVVAALIAVIAFKLANQTTAVLLDTAPEGMASNIRELLERKQHVLSVRQLRIRPAGPVLFISTVVDVPRTLAVEDIATLKGEIEKNIAEVHPAADILVSTNLIELDSETVFEKIHLLAAQAGHPVHHLTVQELADKKAVSFDIEFDGQTSLLAAHEQATRLEARIRSELGKGVEVESHIEPLALEALPGQTVSAVEHENITLAIKDAADGEPLLSDVHNVRVRFTAGGHFVHYHCRFDGSVSVDTAHAVIDRVEQRLMDSHPGIKRVIAHAEPIGVATHAL